MMKSKKRDAAELEAELLRLNDLVRARRKQLARLDACPNKDCECRAVWHEVVEKNLATQVHNVRTQVRERTAGKVGTHRRKSKRS
jgi:hypothetical protein